jgi:pyruvyltransferase
MKIIYKNITKFYYNSGNGNFGDYINNIFFKKLLNKNLQFSTNHSSYHYFTTGSILSQVNEYSIIWGSGFISKNSNIGGNNFKSNSNKVVKKPFKILSVRGPLTRNKFIRMGIDCPERYGDPLLLFPIIYHNFNIPIKYKYGIIPHYIDEYSQNLKTLISNLDNVRVINIKLKNNNYKEFIDEILSCEYIISSSLHGLMMGIVYRKKTIFIEFSNNVIGGKFKFLDFFASLKIKYNFLNDYSSNIINNVIKVDYNILRELIHNMINYCKFIEDKEILLNKYKEFENKLKFSIT